VTAIAEPAAGPEPPLDRHAGDASLVDDNPERSLLADDVTWGATETVRRGIKASPELRKGIGLTLALAFLGTSGRLVVPVLIQQSIDRGFREGSVDTGLIGRFAAIASVLILLATLCNRWAVVRLARQSEHALYGLRTRAFAHIHSLSVAHHAEERRGALVSRVTSDIETLSMFFTWGGIAWLLDGTLMIVVAVTMFVYNPVLAIVAIGVSAPLFIVLRVLQRRLIGAYAKVRERNAETLTAVSEVVMGAAVVRTYRLRSRTTDRVVRAMRRQRDDGIRAGVIASFLFPSGEMFASLAISAVVITGVALGPESGLTTGALIGFIFLTYRFLEPIAEFTEILDQTQTAVAGWRRVLGILETPIEIEHPDPGLSLPAGPPRIEVDGVSFAYRPRPGQDPAAVKPALVDVHFTIEPATHVAVVGATGSGKTTLAKLLTRLSDPTGGRILVGGVDLRDAGKASLRSKLVMVPQEAFLFDTTVLENVRFGRLPASDDDVMLAFVELGLDGWLATLPDGLQTRVGERGEHLSAGERQLVALARAYVANPTCLVLDEATSSVDPATEARLARALESLARGRTSITIAHRLATAARADWVLVFDQGRLVEQGVHADLVEAGGVYAALHASWLDATAATSAAGT
jgi:ATP-binding cassette, subfamily B, bacterial